MLLARRPLALVLTGLTLAVLAGCGDSRTPAPDLSRIQAPQGVEQGNYVGGTLHFNAPANWATQAGSGPLVVTITSGPAVIAIWRYPRSPGQVLPRDLASLRQARSALLSAAAARDRTLRVISSAVVSGNGVRGVELDAVETIRGQVRRVRSAHLYAGGAELVIDEYAPKPLFHAVDRSVFSPLLHSVRLVHSGRA
jgi:hypothetical protein